MTSENHGLELNNVSTGTITIKVSDYNNLSEDYFENGVARRTTVTYKLTIEHGEITAATQHRRGEVNKHHNWKDITDPENKTIDPENVPDIVKEAAFEKLLGKQHATTRQ